MKYFFNQKTLAAAIGIIIGLAGYEYMSNEKVDFLQLFATIFLSVFLMGMLEMYRSKKG